MIYGIGTDIIEVERIRKFIAKGDAFKERVFTAAEMEYSDSHRDPAPFYAARFSAKEASRYEVTSSNTHLDHYSR